LLSTAQSRPELVEHFITNSGIVRRTATAYLARRFSDTQKDILESRDTAEVFA
jgi:hypothetical protein